MSGRSACRDFLFRHLPISRRLAFARWGCRLGARRWAPALVQDLACSDPAAYHHFLWANHLTPARWFQDRRGFGCLVPARELLLADVASLISSAPPVRSVLDAGCSAGYLLRALEIGALGGLLLRGPLLGFDVDRAALARGRRYLSVAGSRARLIAGDIRCPPPEARGCFDLVFCAGVLMYLPEAQARAVVARLLGQARRLLVLSGPAWFPADNRTLAASIRRSDATFVHNLDAMAAAAAGQVLRRRWHGDQRLGGQSIYFVLARAAANARVAAAE